MEKTQEKKKQRNLPHTYFIIFVILVICAVLTYIIPAGEYDRVENADGRMVVVADSFHSVESSPIKLMDFLKAIPMGLQAQAALIFFVFICGGTFGIFDETKALHVSINKLAKALNGKETLLIVIITTVFSLLGATIAFDPQVIMFVPLGVLLARRCGYDAITGIAMTMGGMYIGFSCGAMCPYTTAVAQGIAGVPIFSGFGFRVIWQLVVLICSCAYFIHYAKKVKANPAASYCYELELKEKAENEKAASLLSSEFTFRQILVVLTLIAGLGVVIYGSLKLKWGTTDMAAAFFAMGIVAGIAGGMSGNDICLAWIKGAKTMVFGALAIGLGAAILGVLKSGMILDTIVSGITGVLQMLPTSVISVGMMIANVIINFFVPSGSGQAVLVMPFMTVIATLTGVSLNTAVVAFQAGDGFSNQVIPTSSTTNACLGAGNVGFEKWIRFSVPLFLIQTGISGVFCIIGSIINL